MSTDPVVTLRRCRENSPPTSGTHTAVSINGSTESSNQQKAPSKTRNSTSIIDVHGLTRGRAFRWLTESMLCQWWVHGAEDLMRFLFPKIMARGLRLRFDPYVHIRDLRRSGKVNEKPPPSKLPAYKYARLSSDDQIRLIYILPGNENSELAIRFTVASLTEAPPYETLSYVWGERRYQRLNCDGSSLVVRQNLYNALQSLRSADEKRLFWIDALSIDQDDLEERNQQVRKMRNIFASSKRTTVWLSSTDYLSDEAVDLLEQLAAAYSAKDFERRLTVEERLWRELGQLSSNPWFYRIWIIQEVVVAQDVVVQFGKHLLAWQQFVDAAECIHRYGKAWQIVFDPTGIIRLDGVRRLYQAEGPSWNFLYILPVGKGYLASLDVDHVYAVLGLSNDDIEIDYAESAINLFLRLAKTVIIRDKSIEILNLVDDHAFRLEQGLPSWVPDWEVRQGPRSFMTLWQYLTWNACFSSQLQASLTADGRCLRIHGIVIDQLKHIGDSFRERVPLSGGARSKAKGNFAKWTATPRSAYWQFWTIRRTQQWYNLAMKHGKMFDDLEERHEAYLLTITAGFAHPNTDNNDSITLLKEGYDSWCKVWGQASEHVHSRAMEAYAALKQGELARATEFMRSHIDGAWGRRFFTTKRRGTMGLCPTLSRNGDLLVILDGGKTPYIIRRKMNGKYKFIGECYAHGLMYGEAKDLDWAREAQEFELV